MMNAGRPRPGWRAVAARHVLVDEPSEPARNRSCACPARRTFCLSREGPLTDRNWRG